MRILQKPWQFRKVYASGKKIGGRCAVLFYYTEGAGPESGPTVGVVASRRVGNAVSRNRAKRRIREALRVLTKDIRGPAVWIVCVARTAAVDAPYAELFEELRGQLARLRTD